MHSNMLLNWNLLDYIYIYSLFILINLAVFLQKANLFFVSKHSTIMSTLHPTTPFLLLITNKLSGDTLFFIVT